MRETAALALGRHGDASDGGTLIAGAKQEPWPFVRRAELEALGHLCGAGRGDLMMRAVARDVDEVRRAALVGLARCKDARTRIVLLKHRRPPKRERDGARAGRRAARRVGRPRPRPRCSPTRCAGWSTSPRPTWRSRASPRRRCARSPISAARTPSTPRSRWPADTRHPFRSSAIEALGALCDPDRGRATLRAFVTGGDPALAAAAQNAEHRCAQK